MKFCFRGFFMVNQEQIESGTKSLLANTWDLGNRLVFHGLSLFFEITVFLTSMYLSRAIETIKYSHFYVMYNNLQLMQSSPTFYKTVLAPPCKDSSLSITEVADVTPPLK